MEARRSIHAAYVLIKKAGYSQYEEDLEGRLRTLDNKLSALKER